MRRTEQLQGLRLMKFEDVYGRCYRGDLSQAEASEILGDVGADVPASGGSAMRLEGAAGLYDRRLGRVVGAPRDRPNEVMPRAGAVRDCATRTSRPSTSTKKAWSCEHGFGLSYNWLRT